MLLSYKARSYDEKKYIDENSLAYNLPKFVVGAGLKHIKERALLLYTKSRETSTIFSKFSFSG
jgi:hypothetical protein